MRDYAEADDAGFDGVGYDGTSDRGSALGWFGLIVAAVCGVPASWMGTTFVSEMIQGYGEPSRGLAVVIAALGIASGAGALLVQIAVPRSRTPNVVGAVLGGIAFVPALLLVIITITRQPLSAVVVLLPFLVAALLALEFRFVPSPWRWVMAAIFVVVPWVLILGSVAAHRG